MRLQLQWVHGHSNGDSLITPEDHWNPLLWLLHVFCPLFYDAAWAYLLVWKYHFLEDPSKFSVATSVCIFVLRDRIRSFYAVGLAHYRQAQTWQSKVWRQLAISEATHKMLGILFQFLYLWYEVVKIFRILCLPSINVCYTANKKAWHDLLDSLFPPLSSFPSPLLVPRIRPKVFYHRQAFLPLSYISFMCDAFSILYINNLLSLQ